MGAADSLCLNAIDLSNFFEGDGKIYGYQGLKVINVMRFVLISCFVFFYLTSMSSNSTICMEGKILLLTSMSKRVAV